MANQTASYVLVALCLLVLAAKGAEARQPRLVPAMYVFGDSTVDVGNNNFLRSSSVARANFPHYGVDFPSSAPTGRFSNGFNTADLLAQLLGFQMSPPAFLSLRGSTMRSRMYKGINFASAGSGLADNTGHLLFGEVIPMSLQLDYFAAVVEHMTRVSGSRKTASLLSRSIFFISTGSNDMIEYSVSRGNDTEFLRGLVATYKRYVTALYTMGARKFSVISIPPLGCLPSQRLRRLKQMGTQGCYDPLNDLSLRSYPMLAAMLQQLAYELPGMTYSLGDAFSMVSFVFANPRTNAWSFTVLEAACCGGGPFGAAYACNQTAPLCLDREDHLFWDANHPTQAVSGIAAQTLFAGNRTFVNPINVRQLALL
ncbi:GDSL esterase/lipase At5g55050-like [Phragmites australis]|uniref:GDSL esterase/lipase At5g55050-like n=1 Tax=Phragmites australis TaxID=29695 RepID=UPI002D783E9F|nr:GDSL esterase/lipase At5g55050-like [Phragmites australis]